MPPRSPEVRLRSILRIAAALPLNVRRAWRAARNRPVHSVTLATTVALIVAVASVAFVIFDVTVVRPLPFRDGNQLVMAYTMPPGMEDRRFRNPLHAIDLVRFRERSRTLVGFEGLFVREHAVAVAADPDAHPVGHASAGLFGLLGFRAVEGRTFSATEDRNRERVAVVSHAYARQAFAGETAVGRKILIDGEPHVVVGVLAGSDRIPFAPADLYTPLGISETVLPNPFATYIFGVGRLAPAATLSQASAELGDIMSALGREFPRTHDRWTAGAVSMREWQYGDSRYAVTLLMAAAIGVLIVGWVNVFNLSLAEAVSRRGEFRLSLALGAGRADVIAAQLVSVALTITAGAAAGIGLGAVGTDLVRTYGGGAFGPPESLRIDARVQLAVLAVTAVAAVAAALVSALRASRSNDAPLSPRVAGARGARVVRVALIATQVAVAVTLTAGTVAFGRTLKRLQERPVGFDASRVLAVQLRMPARLYPGIPERGHAMSAFVQSIRALPGVTSVGSTTNPLSPGSAVATLIEVEDRPSPTGAPIPTQVRMLVGDYFEAVRIPIERGRGINDHDTFDAPPVVVVSRLLAEKFWPDGDALGRRIRRPQVDPRWMTVVGIAADVSDIRVGQPPEPILYTSYLQFNSEVAPVALMVRTTGDPKSIVAPVRRAILAYNPVQPVYRTNGLQLFVDASFAAPRSRAIGLATIALLGVVLASVGVYGVVARSVAERTSEIGIRKALGASAWRASVGCARDTGMGVVAGAIAAVPLTLLSGRLVGRVLPDVAQLTLVNLGATILACVVVAAVAAAVPLRRAIALDPLVALRRV